MNTESNSSWFEFEELYLKDMAECKIMMKTILLEYHRTDGKKPNNPRQLHLVKIKQIFCQ